LISAIPEYDIFEMSHEGEIQRCADEVGVRRIADQCVTGGYKKNVGAGKQGCPAQTWWNTARPAQHLRTFALRTPRLTFTSSRKHILHPLGAGAGASDARCFRSTASRSLLPGGV
jgi:hypothetical protein